MPRRRPKLTPQEKSDRKWERMSSQPRTMGMVGIFNDLNPAATHAEAQIVQQRETFADQVTDDSEPKDPDPQQHRTVAVDPRSPAGSGKGSITISLTPKPEAT